jgi:hypothetical protein
MEAGQGLGIVFKSDVGDSVLKVCNGEVLVEFGRLFVSSTLRFKKYKCLLF